MDTKTELLPCPCCGGKADFFDDKMTGYVFCTCCELKTSGTYSWRYEDWKETEAKDWNTRVYPPEVQTAIERDKVVNPKVIFDSAKGWLACGSCGATVVGGHNYCSNCGKRLDWSEE